jgi:hypothetical protein
MTGLRNSLIQNGRKVSAVLIDFGPPQHFLNDDGRLWAVLGCPALLNFSMVYQRR